jgi:YD repeat-containing protein
MKDNHEFWQEFDKNNNIIHYKDNSGHEHWQEYDINNNLIHYREK